MSVCNSSFDSVALLPAETIQREDSSEQEILKDLLCWSFYTGITYEMLGKHGDPASFEAAIAFRNNLGFHTESSFK